jgi:hypothetical protein
VRAGRRQHTRAFTIWHPVRVSCSSRLTLATYWILRDGRAAVLRRLLTWLPWLFMRAQRGVDVLAHCQRACYTILPPAAVLRRICGHIAPSLHPHAARSNGWWLCRGACGTPAARRRRAARMARQSALAPQHRFSNCSFRPPAACLSPGFHLPPVPSAGGRTFLVPAVQAFPCPAFFHGSRWCRDSGMDRFRQAFAFVLALFPGGSRAARKTTAASPRRLPVLCAARRVMSG